MSDGKILTAAAIRAWANGSVYMAALVTVAVDRLTTLHIPSTALAAGLHGATPVRASAIEERLDDPIFVVDDLDRDTATAVARVATRWHDDGLCLANAHVILAATSLYTGWPVVTTAAETAWGRYLPDTPIEWLP